MTDTTLADYNNPGASSSADTGGNTPSHAPAIVEWFYDEGKPGEGPVPDFLDPKYGNNVAKQAKAYKEAQKLLGAQKGAPEHYDFSEVQDHINQDSEVIKEFIAYAKENRLSQDAVGKMAKTWVDYSQSLKPNVDAEIAKLGPDGPQKITTVQNWIKNNLTPESAKALANLPVKAEVVSMLDEMRQLYAKSQARIPGGDMLNTPVELETMTDVENDMKDPRYMTDPRYRASITKRIEIIKGRE